MTLLEGGLLVARLFVGEGAQPIEAEGKTASLYTALLDERKLSSWPRYNSPTVTSFD